MKTKNINLILILTLSINFLLIGCNNEETESDENFTRIEDVQSIFDIGDYLKIKHFRNHDNEESYDFPTVDRSITFQPYYGLISNGEENYLRHLYSIVIKGNDIPQYFHSDEEDEFIIEEGYISLTYSDRIYKIYEGDRGNLKLEGIVSTFLCLLIDQALL